MNIKKAFALLLPIFLSGTSAQAMISRHAQLFSTRSTRTLQRPTQERSFVSLVKNFWYYDRTKTQLSKQFNKELKQDVRDFKLFNTAHKQLVQREQLFRKLTPLAPATPKFDTQKIKAQSELNYALNRLNKIKNYKDQLDLNRAQYLRQRNELLFKPMRWLKHKIFG